MDIRRPVAKAPNRSDDGAIQSCHIVVPGDVITKDTGFMRGHGTFTEGDTLLASVPGVIERHNKLICARPLSGRYNGEVGDVVVGRIVELAVKKWRVETNSRLRSVLNLASINLPGGVLRRRGAEDELMMREYLKEGDLISAEVQAVHGDGILSLHTRSLKYGKLGQGTLVKVAPSLIKRCKSHFHNLSCGAMVILGHNGYCWISPLVSDEEAAAAQAVEHAGQRNMSSHAVAGDKTIALEDRETIARLRNCIVALSQRRQLIFDTSIVTAHEFSLRYPVKDLMKPEIIDEINAAVRQVLSSE
ncbi:exosome complex component RRP4-like [Sycon ciliatum]|uniref:exosome complex component RRP4-like n=1 Tax=Sycon ciliatum TaxID=27933 RepID=UPI0020A8DF07|eukprot:scpid74230/ scgid16813/ Exosome complex component RRP4; Exosome component 2; Ribosomal RNA-processing protein 4